MTDDAQDPLDAAEELALPPELGAELGAVFRAPEGPPARVDDAILSVARTRAFQIREQSAPRVRPFTLRTRWIAAAAALLLACTFLFRELGESPADPQVAALPAFERAAEVDVLDAFQLARLLRAERADLAAGGWDVDASGTVDQRDVESLLAQAVRIEAR